MNKANGADIDEEIGGYSICPCHSPRRIKKRERERERKKKRRKTFEMGRTWHRLGFKVLWK